MAVATRKTASERRKAALQRKKRKFKRKDPKRSRAMKRAWKSKRTKLLKGVKTRKRLYQSAEAFIDKFNQFLESYSTEFKWKDVSEDEDVAVFESEKSTVCISISLTDDEKVSVDVQSVESNEILETFTVSLESSDLILKGVFQAYCDWVSKRDKLTFENEEDFLGLDEAEQKVKNVSVLRTSDPDKLDPISSKGRGRIKVMIGTDEYEAVLHSNYRGPIQKFATELKVAMGKSAKIGMGFLKFNTIPVVKNKKPLKVTKQRYS